MYGWTHSSFHLNTLIIYLSCSLSLIILIVSIVSLIYYPPKKHRDSSYLLFNLFISLSIIQIVFLTGQPFKSNRILYTYIDRSVCKLTATLLHYLHLTALFWMLSNSIHLHHTLWRPQQVSASPNYNSNLHPTIVSFIKVIFSGVFFTNQPHLCTFKYLFLISWTVPAFCVTFSYLMNPFDYESKR